MHTRAHAVLAADLTGFSEGDHLTRSALGAAMFRSRRAPKFVEDPRHQFSVHWFSENRWQFENHVLHLAGTPCRILEIGCYEGEGTCWLLENVATHADARITCADICEWAPFWSNIRASEGQQKVELKLGASRDTLPHFPHNFFDFIFIDGSHLAIDVLEDAVLSFRLAKVGAIIGFDDYLWKLGPDRPKAPVDAFLAIYKPKIEVLAKNYQVWIRKIAE